jgi:hypothetical protein
MRASVFDRPLPDFADIASSKGGMRTASKYIYTAKHICVKATIILKAANAVIIP